MAWPRSALLHTFVAFDAFSPENGEENMLQFVSCLGVFILIFKIITEAYIKASYVYHVTTCMDTFMQDWFFIVMIQPMEKNWVMFKPKSGPINPRFL